jgi:L-asparaginase II
LKYVNDLKMEELLAEYVRGGLVESKHFGHLMALSSDGEEVLVKGDRNALIYPRSAFKSIQASAMVRNGLVQEIRHLALICASHSGTKAQQEGARSILQSAGLTESDLRCVADRPLGVVERKEWGDKEPAPIAMNCSGKHAGMLATCVVNGWPTESYTDMSHPLQIAIKEELEALSEEKISQISVDGCGAPTFALTLRGNTKAFHNLATSQDPVHKQVVAACLAHPEIVAGEGRTDTELMRKVPGLFMKGGAEGVQAAFMTNGATVFFKVTDGADRAHQVILKSAFAKLGVNFEVKNPEVLGGGKPVGEIRAAL